MMSSSEYLLLESECSFTKYVSSCPNTNIIINNSWNKSFNIEKAKYDLLKKKKRLILNAKWT